VGPVQRRAVAVRLEERGQQGELARRPGLLAAAVLEPQAGPERQEGPEQQEGPLRAEHSRAVKQNLEAGVLARTLTSEQAAVPVFKQTVTAVFLFLLCP
jgi:hypothetical protein